MGGIAGIYSRNDKNLGETLLIMLKRLEHLGNQGSGIAVINSNGEVIVEKYPGSVDALRKRIDLSKFVGVIGIGSTRFATHGRPDINNTQPLTECTGNIFVVMNGVIKDYDILRQEMERKKHIFFSKNDTELLAHYIEDISHKMGVRDAIFQILKDFEGFFSAIIVNKNSAGNMYFLSKGPKIHLGMRNDDLFIASELEALINVADKYTVVGKDEVGIIENGSVHFFNSEGELINKKFLQVPDKVNYKVPGGFNHYMLREIFEIPEAILRSIYTYQKTYVDLIARMIINAERIYMIGCGTSYYAAQVGSYLLRELADIPSETVDATEFIFYALKNVKPGTVIIAFSQSGTTTDVIRAVMKAKMFGASIIGIMNIIGSPLMFASNLYLPIGVGPEHAVPATKSFVGQLVAMYTIAFKLAEMRNSMSREEIEKLKKELMRLPSILGAFIEKTNMVAKRIAKEIVKYNSVFVASRGINYPVALEGALKLKEVAYMHAEGIEAGELRHGPRAILSEGFPVILVMPAEEDARTDTYQLVSELIPIQVKPVIVTDEKDVTRAQKLTNLVILTPTMPRILTPIVNVIPLQLIAYWAGVAKGNPIDKPRGLQKFVVL